MRRKTMTPSLWPLICLAGCLAAPTEAPGTTPLEGRWELTGQASTGVGGTFQGALTVQSASASSFTGSYDVLETVPAGGQRRLSGPIAGRMAGGTTTEFEVSLGTVVRRHVATAAGDTLRGSWFDVAPTGAVNVSGSFRAIRR